jgi:hypothetical protein
MIPSLITLVVTLMDFRFFEFLQGLQRSILTLSRKMTDLVARIQFVIEYFQNDKVALAAELAATREALAAALSNDAADAETIAQAQSEAAAAHAAHEAAAAKAAELQGLVDADTEEDAAITALLDSVEIPA